jgi:hypothetical protein
MRQCSARLAVSPDSPNAWPGFIVGAALLVGLLITAPLLGHATWHAYRDMLR